MKEYHKKIEFKCEQEKVRKKNTNEERNREMKTNKKENIGLVWFGWFVGNYGISTFVGYLTPNPFLCN